MGSKSTKHRGVDGGKSPSHLFLPANEFLPLHYGDGDCFLCPRRDIRCVSKQSVVSLFFSLRYPILVVPRLAVVSKTSSGSWCQRDLSFLGTWVWLPAASSQGLPVASQPTCALK